MEKRKQTKAIEPVKDSLGRINLRAYQLGLASVIASASWARFEKEATKVYYSR